jgi:hypothetical protein
MFFSPSSLVSVHQFIQFPLQHNNINGLPSPCPSVGRSVGSFSIVLAGWGWVCQSARHTTNQKMQ